MPRCLWELESTELNQKGAAAATLSGAGEATGHSGTPPGTPAVKAKCMGWSPLQPLTALPWDPDGRFAQARQTESCQDSALRNTSGATRNIREDGRSSLRRGEKSEEPGGEEPRREFQEKESDLQG